MIDTIVLRLHNLEKYAETVNYLFKVSKTGKTYVYGEKPEASEGKPKYQKNNEVISVVYHDTGNFLPLSHRGSMRLGSYHYSLAYCIDNKRDFIEFNFSIPKYKYGNNLMQFIDYYDQSHNATFYLLMNFIKSFVKSRLFANTVDMKDLEINRIDFCYNQFFPSYEDAMNYLEKQGLRMAKFKTSGEQRIAVRTTGIEIVTDRYKFKIYHKGTEFLKHDYPKLQKLNKDGRYDLQKMVDIAHRTLRYEVTYRNSFMNYAFKRMYVDNSPVKVKNYYRRLFAILKIDEQGRSVKTTELKRKQFYIQSLYDYAKDFEQTGEKDWYFGFIGDTRVTFDINLFRYLYAHFWNYCKKFQLTNTSTMEDIQRKIEKYQKGQRERNYFRTKKENIANENRLMFYAMLSNNLSLKEYMRKGFISKRTYYRVMKVFKELGLEDYNPTFKTVLPSLDFQDYKYYFGQYY